MKFYMAGSLEFEPRLYGLTVRCTADYARNQLWLLPLYFVRPVGCAHWSSGDVFGVACLEAMSAARIGFAFTFLFGGAFYALLSEADGFDL